MALKFKISKFLKKMHYLYQTTYTKSQKYKKTQFWPYSVFLPPLKTLGTKIFLMFSCGKETRYCAKWF